MKTIAVILASGIGKRFDKKLIKQYQYINNKAVILHSTKVFYDNPNIDKVVLVINKKYQNITKICLEELATIDFVYGGDTRKKSVYNALKYIKKFNPINILIHDSVRPNINNTIINNIIKKLDKYNAVVPVISINDALKKIKNNKIIEHVDRNKFSLVQTPQGFKYEELYLKHKINFRDKLDDDSTLFDNVHYVKGNINNLKITTKNDLKYLEYIMYKDKKYKQISGIGLDIHKFSSKENTKYIKLGGVKVDHNRSLLGHSDADVIIHSLVDSILGTISEGDIGSIFSDKDPKWKNANSKIFLNHAMSLLKKHKCILLHTDINVICEEPKISKYRDKIKNNIAKLLNVSHTCVSIKATTTETLGFTGRKEGIMAQCITTISKPY